MVWDRRRWGGSSGVVGSWGLICLLMIWSIALVAITATHGIGATPDSVNYLAGAESLLRSGEVLRANGSPMTTFPPGLSLLLAGLSVVGFEVPGAVVALNALCAAASVALTFTLARSIGLSTALSLACATILATSKATLYVHVYLWSEPPFSVLVLAVLVMLVRGCATSGFSGGRLALIGAMVSAATALRFLGLLLIPVVIAAVLAAGLKRDGWRRAGARAGVAALIASIGLICVVGRNLALGQPPLGARSTSASTLSQVGGQALNALGDYALAGVFPQATAAIGVVVAVLLAGSLFAALWRREIGPLLVAGFVVLWWAALVYSALTTALDPIGARLLAPAFGPMVVILGYGAGVASSRLRGSSRRAGRSSRGGFLVGAGIAALASVVVISSVGSIRYASYSARVGLGFSGVALQRSEVFAAIADLPAEAGIAMSDPERLYWVSRRRAVAAVPRDDYWYPVERQQRELAVLQDRIGSGKVTHIAFYDKDATSFTADDLQSAGLPIELLRQLEDGAVYQVVR